jgi:hypothetical protein
MSEQYNMLLVAWLFMMLIGGWLLVNALIDLGARHIREWLTSRGLVRRVHWPRRAEEPLGTRSAPERHDTSSTQPIV